MGAHVVGALNVLRVNAVLRLALEVLHFKGRIERPERAVLVQVLGEVVEFHGGSPVVDRVQRLLI